MSNEILDHFEDDIILDSRKHQKIAQKQIKRIGYAFVAMLVCSIFVGNLSENANSVIGLILLVLFIICVASSFIGTIHGVKSYAKREPAASTRFLTLLVNGFFVIIFILLIFVNILDIVRHLN